MKWLVSAFEPFGGATTNSSLKTLKRLSGHDWQGQAVFVPNVPVEFERGWKYLEEQIAAAGEIGGVLALGQAESRSKISLERVALNWIDARLEDNARVKPEQQKIADGAEVLWSNIPWERFDLSKSVERSYSAGTFVCNELMYRLINWANSNAKLAGFVHIPALVSQSDPIFQNSPRINDQTAESELKRILEFLVQL
jgi:pyroglutamyl-peptidase